MKWKGITLMVICTILTSTAQFLYKAGANKLSLDIYSIILNWPLILGLVLYAIGALLVIFAFKYGKVTELYPVITLSYVWVAIGSWFLFNEIMGIGKIVGIGMIMGGIILTNG